MDESVLVLGGCGYIGGYLTDQLQYLAYRPTVYDNLAYETRFMKKVPFIYGDIRDRPKLSKLLPHFKNVVLLAAIVGDGACAADPFLTQSINCDAVKWIVDNFKGKLIYMSTCSVYGVNNDLIDETSTPNPLSVYASTKLEAEQYILKNRPDALVFRLGTLYGLGDAHSRIRLDLVVNILTKRAVCGEKLTVFGGDQWRPLLHVRDVARAIIHGLEYSISGLYNLSSQNARIWEIAHAIQDLIPGCVVEKVDMSYEDQRNYRVSTAKWDALGWQPAWMLKEGIQQIALVIQEARIKNPADPIYSNQAAIEQLYKRWI